MVRSPKARDCNAVSTPLPRGECTGRFAVGEDLVRSSLHHERRSAADVVTHAQILDGSRWNVPELDLVGRRGHVIRRVRRGRRHQRPIHGPRRAVQKVRRRRVVRIAEEGLHERVQARQKLPVGKTGDMPVRSSSGVHEGPADPLGDLAVLVQNDDLRTSADDRSSVRQAADPGDTGDVRQLGAGGESGLGVPGLSDAVGAENLQHVGTQEGHEGDPVQQVGDPQLVRVAPVHVH